MYSAGDAPHAHAYGRVPAQCDPAPSTSSTSDRPAPPASLQAYDPDTMDALMLFHTPVLVTAPQYYQVVAPYDPNPVVETQRRHQALARERNEETRRAMHREVQRRFIKRKQAEFAELRSRARKLELRNRTLLLRSESDKLREERAWLVRRCRAQGIELEGVVHDADEGEEDESKHDDVGIKREASCDEQALPRKLFDFDLSSNGAIE